MLDSFTNVRRLPKAVSAAEAVRILSTILALAGLQILPMPSQVVAGWIHLLGRHAVEGAGVFDLQIIATMLANGVHDGIDTLSLASPPSCGRAVCRIL